MIQRYKREKLAEAYCFDLVRDEVKWVNGSKMKRELLIHPGITVMLPLLGKDRIILVRQYRYGADKKLWELPAGTLKSQERPLQCAKREMEEEIGYRARKWEKLTSCYVSPAFSTEIMHCFLASSLYPTQTNREDYEVMDMKEFKLSEIQKMIQKKQILDAKTIVSFFYYEQKANA